MRIVAGWVALIGADLSDYGTHSRRETLIYSFCRPGQGWSGISNDLKSLKMGQSENHTSRIAC